MNPCAHAHTRILVGWLAQGHAAETVLLSTCCPWSHPWVPCMSMFILSCCRIQHDIAWQTQHTELFPPLTAETALTGGEWWGAALSPRTELQGSFLQSSYVHWCLTGLFLRGVTGKGLADVDTSLDPHLSPRLASSRTERTNILQWLTAGICLRRATPQGIGITVVSPDVTVVKVTKKEQEAGQQVSVRSAICSMFIWASQHRILKHDNLGGIWLPEDSTWGCFRCPGYLIW